MKKKTLVLVTTILFPVLIYGAGEADGGRDSVTAMVQEGSFVAASYLDYEFILDDYEFPYKAQPDAALSVFLDVEKPLVPEWGDENALQISLSTAPEEFFPERSFDYVIFPYAEELFDDDDLLSGLKRALRALLTRKSEGQRIWFFFRKTGELVELTSAYQISRYLERAEEQLETRTVGDAVRRLAEAERDLEALLTAADASAAPRKYLWLLDKPLADTAADFRSITGIISGYGDSSTEISFCGFGDSFRAQTINTFVKTFGGNSYFVVDGADMEETIIDDFAFYRRPALNDLEIRVYSLGAHPRGQVVKEYRLVSVGPDEQHVFLAHLPVPSRLEYTKTMLTSLGTYSAVDTERMINEHNSYPLAYVTISYFDQHLGSYAHSDMMATVNYTSDYDLYMNAQSSLLRKNLTILETYNLLGSVAARLSYGNYVDAIVDLGAHIKKLERLNIVEADPLVQEDIELLVQYKQLILENKNSLGGAIKAFREIELRRY